MELRVRKICKEKGLSIAGLAEQMKINKVSLSKAINGNPTIGTLQKIADALGVPLVSLFSANCPNCGARFFKIAEAAEQTSDKK